MTVDIVVVAVASFLLGAACYSSVLEWGIKNGYTIYEFKDGRKVKP